MDITQLYERAQARERAEDVPVDFPLLGPDDAPLEENGRPVTVGVVGKSSRTYREAQEAKMRAFLHARPSERSSVAWLREQSAMVFAMCIKRWDGFTANGLPIPPTADAIAKLLVCAPWFEDRVNTMMGGDESHWPDIAPVALPDSITDHAA